MSIRARLVERGLTACLYTCLNTHALWKESSPRSIHMSTHTRLVERELAESAQLVAAVVRAETINMPITKCLRTCLYACLHAYLCICLCACLCACPCLYTCLYTCAQTSACVYTCLHACPDKCLHTCSPSPGSLKPPWSAPKTKK